MIAPSSTLKSPEALPLVAVVTPTYNGGKYLDRAMKCVQAQTYPNIVHIVLNNASTDNTAEILAEYEQTRIPVIVYRNEEVLKQQANWNKAFSYLPEDAVFAKLLCDDDLMRPQAIERFVELAQSDPQINIVLSDDVFDDHLRGANLPANQTVFDGQFIARRMLSQSISWLPCHHFFIRIPDDLRGDNFLGSDYSQDYNLVVATTLRGKFGYIHEPLVYTRYHADSVTGQQVKSRGVSRELMDLTVLKRYGARVYGDATNNPAKTIYINRMCRFILQWTVRANREQARVLRQALQAEGITLSVWNYISAVIAWPGYFLTKHRWHRTPDTALDEAHFLALP